MKVHQVVEAGQVAQSYVWTNGIEFTIEGGDEIKLEIREEKMRLLHNQLKRRLDDLEEERLALAKDKLERVASSGE